MSKKLSKQTVSSIENALADKKTTAIGEVVQIIQEMASKAFRISIPELSKLIGRDTTITEKVISAANTLGFNPNGTEVSTIAESIHTIGFEKIRNLTISILLVENAGQSTNSFEQREIASLAVCSGLMAQQLSNHRRLSADPELSFVCASLRNYGKLLMSSFMVEKFREAKALSLEMGQDEAFTEVFGITPLDLGMEILSRTHLPKSILAALQEVPKGKLRHVAQTDSDEVLIMSELCVNICEVAFDNSIEPDQFNEALLKLVDRFSRTLPISLDGINQALVDMDTNLQMFNRVIGARGLSSPAAANIQARVSGKKLPPRPYETRIEAKKKQKPVSEMNPEEREEHAEESFQNAIDQISGKTAPGEEINLDEIYDIAVKTITEGLGLATCMIFVNEEHDPRSYSARFGSGQLFKRIRNRPMVSKIKKDIFSICINRKEDILIQDVTAGKIRSVIPDWIDGNSETTSLLILPVVLEDDVFAIIFGSVDENSINLEKNDHRRLKQMRAHLSELQRKVTEQRALKSA